ncbi:unnamed protein product [Sphagnum jensenii]|uniref:Uncharacterized protein n=1 Tax=Sphagnum jensenii TaxID=128206 RepID=A0ABP0VCU0_9BRYO
MLTSYRNLRTMAEVYNGILDAFTERGIITLDSRKQAEVAIEWLDHWLTAQLSDPAVILVPENVKKRVDFAYLAYSQAISRIQSDDVVAELEEKWRRCIVKVPIERF